jgi:uncharacterized protein YgbK (DUF1537 family)
MLAQSRGPVVLFIGSINPVTEAQVEYLLSNRLATRLLAGREEIDTAGRILQQGRHLVITVDPGADDPERVSKFCAPLANFPIQGLILSGGDTAHLVCRALGAAGIRLRREIVAGLPWGWLMGGLADGWPVATKAGGFGERESLATALDFLSSCERS